ncbi:hypothetical protein AYI70_g2143 [Smittium culicis]|uniref:Uncharacterized protein n=1 Tax=Smittium culicis TaxID=133412 RepID=A0A1R1Y9S5_9FUNG|nr:hypothetical protein AYI70_g2143 [Smittium culicis]
MIFFNNFASEDVGVGSAITIFHTSDGTPSAAGAFLFGVSARAPLELRVSQSSMQLLMESGRSGRFFLSTVYVLYLTKVPL